MPYNVTVIVRGTKDDHKIASPWFDTREQAEAEMQKIRESQRRYSDQQYNEARDALPDWLIVDTGLIVTASVSGTG